MYHVFSHYLRLYSFTLVNLECCDDFSSGSGPAAPFDTTINQLLFIFGKRFEIIVCVLFRALQERVVEFVGGF